MVKTVSVRSFQAYGPACENDLLPSVLELERGILRSCVLAEEQRSLEKVYRWRSYERWSHCDYIKMYCGNFILYSHPDW